MDSKQSTGVLDIPRPSNKRQRRIRRIVYSVVGLVAIASITVFLSRLKPAAPSVDKATVWIDTVKSGPMLLEVRRSGTLEAIYVGRPVFAQPNSTVGMFKLDPDGKGASLVQVKLGRASVNSIEILSGLQPGDKVVLSDMSTWDKFTRIRLE